MNALSKLEILKKNYCKRKEELNLVKGVEEDKKLDNLTDSNFGNSSNQEVAGEIETTVEDDLKDRVNNLKSLFTVRNTKPKIKISKNLDDEFLITESVFKNPFERAKKEENLYLDISSKIKSINVSNVENTFNDINQSLKDNLTEESDSLKNIHYVEMISLLTEKIKELNLLNFPLCSLTLTENLIKENKNIEETEDALFNFLDVFIDTYMDEELKVFEDNKLEYEKQGKLNDFKKFQYAKIEKMSSLLYIIINGD